MTVRIDEVQTEIVGGDAGGQRAGNDAPFEQRKEELRAVIRELLAEELERFMRTEAGR